MAYAYGVHRIPFRPSEAENLVFPFPSLHVLCCLSHASEDHGHMILKGHMGAIPSEDQDDDENEEDTNSIDREVVGTHEEEEEEEAVER